MYADCYILALSRNQCRTGKTAVPPLHTEEPYFTVNSIKVSCVAFVASRRQQYNLLSFHLERPKFLSDFKRIWIIWFFDYYSLIIDLP